MSFEAAQRQTDEVISRLIAQRENEIIREYAKTLQSIRLDLAKAYEKYGKDTLTYAEMAKYGRLANLEQSIFSEVNRLTGSTGLKLKSAAGQVYQETFYRTAFNLESTLQTKLGFGLLNPNTIKRAVDNPLDRYGTGARKNTLGFLMRNSANTARLKEQIRGEITQGLIRGQPYQSVAKAIKEKMDIGAKQAQRIAQTEMHRTQTQGRLDSLEHARAAGVEMVYQWVATLDTRTRETHQVYDGMKTEPAEYPEPSKFNLPGIGLVDGPGMTGVASEDINCRCTMIGVIPGFEPTERRARDGGVVPYQNYREYAESKGWPTFYKGAEPRVKAQIGTYTGKNPNLFKGTIDVMDEERMEQFIKDKFGDNVTINDIARATGVHGNEDVMLTITRDDTIGFDVRGYNYTMKGYIEPWQDAYTNRHIFIELMKSEGGGHAAQVIAMQTEHLAKLGIKEIALEAAGVKGGWNGYYTWPRLGFDVKLKSNLTKEQIAKLAKTPFSSATTLQEIMMHPKGAAWWKEHGKTIGVSFDTTPGSISRQVLEEYLRARGL